MSLPVVVDGLDVEPQSGADGVDVLTHDFFDYRGLARIVEAATGPLSNRIRAAE